MLKRIAITPYFGEFPPWMDKFKENFEATLGVAGYTWLLDTDLEGFKRRVKSKLNIEFPGTWGSPKVWDYRGALGLLYEEEIRGYDFWLHHDFDMCFGDVSKFFPDYELEKLDVWSAHDAYVCGCWTLYRNCEDVNTLFMQYRGWEDKMNLPEANGWVEQEYSRLLEASGLSYQYADVRAVQGNPWTKSPNLTWKGGKLYQDNIEIAFFHFRHSKQWPL